MNLNSIYHGNCLDILQNFDDNSVDAIITDPPYALTSGEYKHDNHKGGFMGKSWDARLPSVDIWKECLRVLKHGAFAAIMSSPRQDVLSRMIVNLQDAGFRTDFSSIVWTYASGFPKALNISKKILKDLELQLKNGLRDRGY